MPFTARIERAQFHRARSASKKGTWPLPPHPSEAARSASTETMPAAPPSSPSRTHLVTQAGSRYNPPPASRWTDCTTQSCEHTDDSPFTDPLAHPRPAVSHQHRHLYRPRQYLHDRAADDAGLWDDRSTDGLSLLGLRQQLCPVSDSRWMKGAKKGKSRSLC